MRTTEYQNTATYQNKATGETYRLGGVKNLEHAWDLAEWVCSRKGWNLNTFCSDVRVSISGPAAPKKKHLQGWR